MHREPHRPAAEARFHGQGSYTDYQAVEDTVRVRRDRQALLTSENAAQFGVRDSKLGTTSPVLTARTAQWISLLAGVQDGTLHAWPPAHPHAGSARADPA